MNREGRVVGIILFLVLSIWPSLGGATPPSTPIILDLEISHVPGLFEQASVTITLQSIEDAPNTNVELMLPKGAVAQTQSWVVDLTANVPVILTSWIVFQEPGNLTVSARALKLDAGVVWGDMKSVPLYISPTAALSETGWKIEQVPVGEGTEAGDTDAISTESTPFSFFVPTEQVLAAAELPSVEPARGPVSVAPTPSAPGIVTLTGRWQYHDRSSVARDIDQQIIEIRRGNGTPLNPRVFCFTNTDGTFSCPFEHPGSTMRVWVRSWTNFSRPGGIDRLGVFSGIEIPGGCGSDSIDCSYPVQTGEISCADGATCNVGTWIVTTGIGEPWLGAHQMTQDLIRSWKKIFFDPKHGTGITAGPGRITYPVPSGHGTHAHVVGNFDGWISIEPPNQQSADVVNHEYGHVVMSNLWVGAGFTPNWPTDDCPFPHFIHLVSRPGCALSEGFANFWTIYSNEFYDGDNVTGNDGPVFNWPSGASTNLETRDGGTYQSGDQVEGNVAAAMWDIHDTANESPAGVNVDNLSDGVQHIWHTTSSQSDSNFAQWWDAYWLTLGHSRCHALGILRLNTINYASTCPELAVQSINTNPVSPVAGQSVNVTVTVTNQGTTAAGSFFIDWYANRATPPPGPPDPTRIGQVSCSRPGLAAGATDNCTGTFIYATAGTFQMWAQVDRERAVAETNENNNIFGPQAITVQEPPTVTITATDANAAEPSDPGTFTVSRTAPTSSPLTVFYAVGGTATNGVDYQNLPGSVTIPTGSSTAPITVIPIDDTLVEGDESVVVQLQVNPAYNLGTPSGATVIIADNDVALPTVTITATDPNAAEPSDPATFTVSRSGPTSSPLTVFYAVGGTATNGVDYQNLPGSVTIPAGSSTAPITVIPTDDTLVEGDESVVVQLQVNPAYNLGTPSGATVIIADNDPALLPDLIVQEITTNPASPVGGQPVNVTMTVRNQGSAAAGEFVFDWYANRATPPPGPPDPARFGNLRCGVLGLTAGDTTTCSFTFTYNEPGSFQMWAQVDTERQVAEANETNNIVGPQAITVQPQQFTLTVNKLGTGSGTVRSADGRINCDPTCSTTSTAYTAGRRVDLMGTPDAGSFHAGWSGGGCSGTNPCAVTVNSDITVTATVDATLVFFSSPTNTPVGNAPASVVVGDFNGDFLGDLAVTNFTGNNVSVLLGDGLGGFTEALGSPFTVGSNPRSLAAADLNADGFLDLAVANLVSGTVSVLLGDGTGFLSLATHLPVADQPEAIAIGDLNLDGFPDLVVAHAGVQVSVLLADGMGSFLPAREFTVGSVPTSVGINDLNADGIPDIVVAKAGANSISVLLGDGSGAFSPPTDFLVGDTPHALAFGDFNRDGGLDLVVANFLSNSVSVLLGDGTGSFFSRTDFGVGNGPVFVTTGDFNLDGIVDLAVANSSSNSVFILLGDGFGGFFAGANFPVGTNPRSVAVGDFNGDFISDLAVTNQGSNTVSIILGP